MSELVIIILIVILSLVGPFVLKLHKSATVWATMVLVNVVIISVFIVVRDSSPQLISNRTSPFDKLETTSSRR